MVNPKCSFIRKIIDVSKMLFFKKTILFFNHFPNNEELKDGYWQRVNAVDTFLSKNKKIYLSLICGFGRKSWFLPVVSRVGNNTFDIQLFLRNPLHLVLALIFVLMIGKVYVHSIFPLRQKWARFFYFFSRKSVIDLHGVVPEEARFNGEVNVQLYDDMEKFAVKHVTTVVCVTNKMAEHIKHKYNVSDKKLIILPITQPNAKKNIVKEFIPNSVIYCGGLHKWQQIGKMLEFVHRNKKKLNFAFLVPEPDKIRNEYRGKYGEDFSGIVCSVASSEVVEWYKKYSFGLVLREDNIINNVAFPTKLVEYLQNDVVPIVDSPNIGDFMQLDYAYVDYNSGDLPNVGVWQKMVNRNKEVVSKVDAMVSNGIELLKQRV